MGSEGLRESRLWHGLGVFAGGVEGSKGALPLRFVCLHTGPLSAFATPVQGKVLVSFILDPTHKASDSADEKACCSFFTLAISCVL
eukprot:4483947-Amphidinium_carterae.1